MADSESSTIRSITLTKTATRTLVGGDRDPLNLFAFGDVDGKGLEAKLQHPLGVCWLPTRQEVVRAILTLTCQLVCDTYNHKLKLLNPSTNTLTTWCGNGKKGSQDGIGTEASFYEPSGAVATETTVFVADTNNHCLRFV